MRTMATREPTAEHSDLFARFKRHYEAANKLEPDVKTAAVEEMRAGMTVGQLAKATGMTDEVFRRLARANGIDRHREPTVGKDAKPKDS